MNKSFTAEGVQFAWDSTSISLAQACLRKYQYKMIEGWHPHHFSDHLRFGQIYASALEHYYKHVAAGATDNEALCLVVNEAMISSWDHDLDSDGARISGSGKAWAPLDGVKTRENLIRSIVWYIDFFRDEPTPVMILSDGKPAVELSFALPVDNGIVFSGHLDRMVTYADSPYVMDQKTTKTTVGPYYFDQYKPHTQMSMYTFAGKAAFNIPVKGVIIDAAQIAVGFTRFERGFTMRTDDELNEWYDNTMFWIAQAQNATKQNYFPMNAASCFMYGGCEFRKVCSRAPGMRKNFLAADFTQGPTWDPLEKR